MFAQAKIYILIASFVAAVSGSFFFGSHVKGLSDDEALNKVKVEMQAKIDTEQKRREDISSQLELKKDNIRTVTQVVTKTVTKEVEKPVYKECKIPDTGVDLLNQTADQYNAVRNDPAKALGASE